MIKRIIKMMSRPLAWLGLLIGIILAMANYLFMIKLLLALTIEEIIPIDRLIVRIIICASIASAVVLLTSKTLLLLSIVAAISGFIVFNKLEINNDQNKEWTSYTIVQP